MPVPVRRLVLDLLKPHDSETVEFTTTIAEHAGVQGVNAELIETDREVQTLKLTIEGDDIDVDTVEEVIADLGGTVHSIDQVVCGERFVEQVDTAQDR
ncbi:DUF211 domain-containing protein [Natronosalvus rutilus]|uniref:DUF211 domain-containing protein n=1 Tax=Natronosalvus rutilus TaxID=2953753 RepID=A0A9E7N6G8_9EURY|nr:DUF211 domain-containing protein [Natronosalvus rutilus]UTF52607.1 DUF211 domain-containing protein [Natronosalvus rutilus]